MLVTGSRPSLTRSAPVLGPTGPYPTNALIDLKVGCCLASRVQVRRGLRTFTDLHLGRRPLATAACVLE